MKHDELEEVGDIDAGWDDVPESAGSQGNAPTSRSGAILASPHPQMDANQTTTPCSTARNPAKQSAISPHVQGPLAQSAPSRRELAKPLSVAPSSHETDDLDEAWEDDDEDREGDAAAQTSDSEAELEVLPPAKAPQVVVARAKQFDEAAERLDAGWGIDDDGEDDDANAKEAGPALRPEPVRASASRLVASKRDAEPGTGSLTKAAGAKAKPGGEAKDSLADQVRRSRRARVPFKKAHRALSRKNDERSRRRKRTNKAERKAQRREQAKQARAARELQAKAEQKRTQKSRADAGENRSKSSVSVTKRAPERKPAAQAVKRRQTAKQGEPGRLQPDAVAGTARPRKKRNKAREQQRTRQRRQKASMLIAALVLALAALAWFVAGR